MKRLPTECYPALHLTLIMSRLGICLFSRLKRKWDLRGFVVALNQFFVNQSKNNFRSNFHRSRSRESEMAASRHQELSQSRPHQLNGEKKLANWYNIAPYSPSPSQHNGGADKHKGLLRYARKFRLHFDFTSQTIFFFTQKKANGSIDWM